MQEFMNAIQNVGFPIAACCIMFVYMQKQASDHKDEISSLSDVLDSIRITVASLQQLLEDKL